MVDGRRFTVEERKKLVHVDQAVISSWVDETDLCLKTYDIVTMNKVPQGDHISKVANETFSLAPETTQIRVLYNPKLRLKRVNCVDKAGKELNLLIAREYNRDHRDNFLFKKIPKGYKIIGIRGFKYTNGE